MSIYQLDSEKFAAMIALGAENLAKNADFVDSLMSSRFQMATRERI